MRSSGHPGVSVVDRRCRFGDGGRHVGARLQRGAGSGPGLARAQRRRNPQRRNRYPLRNRRPHGTRAPVRLSRLSLVRLQREARAAGAFAPLTVEGNGRPALSIDFDGETFAAGVPTDATYRFNSYRVTYRYRIHDGARFRWHAGITAKIREAEVALSQGRPLRPTTTSAPRPYCTVRGSGRRAIAGR